MDYKAEYNKALEAIKELLENNPSDEGIHNWVNDKFPWLLESKDEKIRKMIINHLMQERGSLSYDEAEEAIDWLEKQDKNIQVMCPTFTFDDILALQCCMETVKKVQEDKELYEQLQSLHDRLHDAYWLERQAEQKPIETTWKPSEEQMKVLDEVLTFAANHENPYWKDYIFGTLCDLIRQLKKLKA